MSNEELLIVRGGGITSTFLNSLARVVTTVYNVGRAVGSTVRRIITKTICKAS